MKDEAQDLRTRTVSRRLSRGCRIFQLGRHRRLRNSNSKPISVSRKCLTSRSAPPLLTMRREQDHQSTTTSSWLWGGVGRGRPAEGPGKAGCKFLSMICLSPTRMAQDSAWGAEDPLRRAALLLRDLRIPQADPKVSYELAEALALASAAGRIGDGGRVLGRPTPRSLTRRPHTPPHTAASPRDWTGRLSHFQVGRPTALCCEFRDCTRSRRSRRTDRVTGA